MYITLTMLKNNSACKPGFGRLATFFGVGPTVRDQKIPLHAVALIGGKSDVEWVLANSVVIDPLEFEDLFRRTLPAVWAHAIHCALIRSGSNPFGGYDGRKDDLLAIVKAAFKAVTTPEILEFRKKYRYYVWEKPAVSDLLSQDWWDSPHKYLLKVCAAMDRSYNRLSGTRSVTVKTEAFPSLSKNHTMGQRLAHILCPVDTYEFVNQMKNKSAARLKKTEEGLVITLKNSEEAFHIMRMIASGTLPDQDELDDSTNNSARDAVYAELHQAMNDSQSSPPARGRPRAVSAVALVRSAATSDPDDDDEDDEDDL